MPRYHFNVEDGALDSEGTELKDLAEAKCEAVKTAGQLVCDAGSAFWDRSEWRMTVTDDIGLTLFELYILGTEAPAAQLASSEPRPIALERPARAASAL